MFKSIVRNKLVALFKAPIHPLIGADPADVVADYLMDNGVTVDEWIPASTPPTINGWYMVYTTAKGGPEKRINKAQYDGKYWHGSGGIWTNVTHWRDLPKAPTNT